VTPLSLSPSSPLLPQILCGSLKNYNLPVLAPLTPLSFLTALLLLPLASPLPVAANPTGNRNVLADGNNAAPSPQESAAQLFNSGVEQYRSGKYQEALKTYQQVLVIHRELSDKAGVALTLHNIGTIYFRLEQTKQALEFWQQALAIRKQIGDKAGVARTLSNISAIENQQRSATSTILVQRATGEISLIFDEDDRAGQTGQGSPIIQRILPSPTTIGDRSILTEENPHISPNADINITGVAQPLPTNQDQKAKAMRLYQSGVKLRNQRQYAAALDKFNQSLTIYREIGDKAGVARTLHKIGTVYFMMGKPRSGRDSFQKALEFFQQARAIYIDKNGSVKTPVF